MFVSKELKEIIKEDKRYYYGTPKKHFERWVTHNPIYYIGRYIVLCRKAGYYALHRETFINKLLHVIYIRRKNILGEKLNIEFGPNEFGRRIRIYHGNIVVNKGAIIGDDCEFYGNNCIGNKGDGFPLSDAPIIEKNVSIGVGTKIVGKVRICANIKISSMSFVNKDINQEHALYGGVPAYFIQKLID